MNNKISLEWQRREYIVEWKIQLNRLNELTKTIHRIDDRLNDEDL